MRLVAKVPGGEARKGIRWKQRVALARLVWAEWRRGECGVYLGIKVSWTWLFVQLRGRDWIVSRKLGRKWDSGIASGNCWVWDNCEGFWFGAVVWLVGFCELLSRDRTQEDSSRLQGGTLISLPEVVAIEGKASSHWRASPGSFIETGRASPEESHV